MPQTGRTAVVVGCRSQYIFVSCLDLLSRGTYPAATVGSNWCQCWQTACWSCSTPPSPTGPWWSGPPYARVQPLYNDVCWLLQSHPDLPPCSSWRYLVRWGDCCTRELVLGPCSPGLRPRHRDHYVKLLWGHPSCTQGRGWLWNPLHRRHNGPVGPVGWFHNRWRPRHIIIKKRKR